MIPIDACGEGAGSSAFGNGFGRGNSGGGGRGSDGYGNGGGGYGNGTGSGREGGGGLDPLSAFPPRESKDPGDGRGRGFFAESKVGPLVYAEVPRDS